MIYIASDHGGYKLKEYLKKFLAKEGRKFIDLGAKKFARDDDYPDYAKLAGQKISRNPNKDMAILLCRSGQGMAIVANKFKGVRAAVVCNVAEAKLSRNDDMSNVLCLPADFISPKSAEHVVEAWLETPYSTEARHLRRVKKISALDK